MYVVHAQKTRSSVAIGVYETRDEAIAALTSLGLSEDDDTGVFPYGDEERLQVLTLADTVKEPTYRWGERGDKRYYAFKHIRALDDPDYEGEQVEYFYVAPDISIPIGFMPVK